MTVHNIIFSIVYVAWGKFSFASKQRITKQLLSQTEGINRYSVQVTRQVFYLPASKINQVYFAVHLTWCIFAELGLQQANVCSNDWNDSSIKKASSYIAQYPVLRTVQSALHFTSLTDLFTQTPSQLLWEASSHMLQLMREGCSYTYPPLSTARYAFFIYN